MAKDPQAARMVAEGLLARTRDALMAGDAEDFCDCFLLPHRIELFDSSNVVETRDDLQAIFFAMRDYLLRHGITEMIRQCVDAEFTDDDTISTTHISRLLRGSELMQAPYPVYSIVRRIDGVWKIAHGKYAIANSPELDRALSAKADGSES